MQKMAADGWELVSGTSYSYDSSCYVIGGGRGPHWVYVQYWRRAISG